MYSCYLLIDLTTFDQSNMKSQDKSFCFCVSFQYHITGSFIPPDNTLYPCQLLYESKQQVIPITV